MPPSIAAVRQTRQVKRALVGTMAKVDEALDWALYRPAVVKAFGWLPRWWLCDLAKLSVALDARWGLGYWDGVGVVPGGVCDVCGRRAAIHVYGGREDDEPAAGDGFFLVERPVHTCGWCHLRGRINGPEDLASALSDARRESVSWRWR